MEPFWISFLHIFFLCAAVCIDTFAAAFGFGIDQIRIPALSALVLSLVSSVCAVPFHAGGRMAHPLPARWADRMAVLRSAVRTGAFETV